MKQNRPGREIVKLLKQNIPPKHIARLLSVSGSSVRYWARKLGMEPFPRGRPPLGPGEVSPNFKFKERAIANKMRLAGKTYREIGKALGVARQRAHQYLKTLNRENHNG